MFRYQTWMLVIASAALVFAGVWLHRSGRLAWVGLSPPKSSENVKPAEPDGSPSSDPSTKDFVPGNPLPRARRPRDLSSRAAFQRWLVDLMLRLRESKAAGKPQAVADAIHNVAIEAGAVKAFPVKWEFPCYLESQGNETVVVVNDWDCFLNDIAAEVTSAPVAMVDYRVRAAESKELSRPAVARSGIEIAPEQFRQLRDGDKVLVQAEVTVEFPDNGQGTIVVHIDKARIVGN